MSSFAANSRAVASMSASARPGGARRLARDVSRSSRSARAAAIANLASIGTTVEDPVIDRSSLRMMLSGSPLRRLTEATSARAMDGVKQCSASFIKFWARSPIGLPRKISTPANVSIVRFNAVLFGELPETPLRTAERPSQNP